MTRYLLLFDSYGLVFLVGRSLWREDGSAFCLCCWPLPEQSFLGPSPSLLATIFYCLKFETSLSVTSYDSQGHGGGIRPHLHTGTRLAEQSSSLLPATSQHGQLAWLLLKSRYIASAPTTQKTTYIVVKECLPQRCIAARRCCSARHGTEKTPLSLLLRNRRAHRPPRLNSCRGFIRESGMSKKSVFKKWIRGVSSRREILRRGNIAVGSQFYYWVLRSVSWRLRENRMEYCRVSCVNV
jgi:hypothetical protein